MGVKMMFTNRFLILMGAAITAVTILVRIV
jgi:hypothetical protein